MEFYGRADDVRRVSRSAAHVTVVSGDSGVGKSAVLAAAVEADRAAGRISTDVYTVQNSGAALQTAVLRCLADAVSDHIRAEGHAKRVANRLVLAGKRLARDRGKELGKVLVKELLGLVKARLGAEVGKGLGDFAKALKTTGEESLSARISAATDPDVAALVLDLAKEVCDLLPGDAVVLSLDACERLSGADRRLLADLRDGTPERLRIRAGFATETAVRQGHVEELRLLGVAEIPLHGISQDGIREWLTDATLDASLAPEVHRATDGYALHVGDLIQHLRTGGTVGTVPLHEQFARRTKASWNGLDLAVAGAARRLCALQDPLPAEQLQKLLEVEASAYGELESRLLRARIFSVSVNGQPWFHEQRRRYVYDVLLGTAEREDANRRAAFGLLATFRASLDFLWLGEFAAKVAAAPGLLRENPLLAAVIRASDEQIAVVAALAETSEDQAGAPAPVDGDVLLLHARRTFGVDGDLVAPLESIVSDGLANVVSEDADGVLVVPAWTDPVVACAIYSRTANNLGRYPIPRAAFVAFGAIVAKVGPFVTAHYGIGTPGAEQLLGMVTHDKEGSGTSSPRLPGLLVRSSYGGRPLFFTFTFENRARRDGAHEAVTGTPGVEMDLFDQKVRLTSTMLYPTERIASRRFLRALGRLTGEPLSSPVSGLRATGRRGEALPFEVSMQVKADTVAVVRDRSSATERFAYGLERQSRIAFYAEPDFLVEAEIVGERAGTELIQALENPEWHDKYAMSRLTQSLSLAADEYVRRRSMQFGVPEPTDPAVEELAVLSERAAGFNKFQPRLDVILEPGYLQPLLESALRQETADALALRSSLGGAYFDREVERFDTRLVADLSRVAPGFAPGAYSHALVVRCPSLGEEETVTIEVAPPGTSGAELNKLVDRTSPNIRRVTHTTVPTALADLLGFAESDLGLRYP